MQGAGENVTHPLRSFASGAPKSFVGLGKGLLGAKGPAPAPGGRDRILVLMLPRWREQTPERTHGSPAWPISPGHSSAVDSHLLHPAFGAPSRPGFLAAGVVDFGVRAIWVCMPTPHFPGAYISSPFWASLILMFWVVVGLEMEYLVSGTGKEIITL